jgi:hypothetical protein
MLVVSAAVLVLDHHTLAGREVSGNDVGGENTAFLWTRARDPCPTSCPVPPGSVQTMG